VIEAIAALVVLLLAATAGLWVQTRRVRDAQVRAKLQGKRVVVEADRRAAVEAAAAERSAAVDAAIDEHIAAIAELGKQRAEIDGAESAEAAADALQRAFK